MKATYQTPNWTPLPDPISENEVKFELSWSADERATEALNRQARLMGFASPTDYLLQTNRNHPGR
jgi:hypothetical protein